MRLLLVAFLSTISLFAAPKDITSFHATFSQTIIDDTKKKILYHGEIWAATPQNALWVYSKPIQKSVYINGSRLTLLEPKLEQATLKNLGDEIDFLQIIKKAKPLNASRYSATVNGQTYFIDFNGDLLSAISYSDNYENQVSIKFINPIQNQPIESSRFKAIIPADYDVIR
ncbi:MAG: LolA-like outer membrane lipoprotein chaperone [Sulfuricurvum sp.]|uniref:LolA-like outer membrane lipoprotein chaperone n=1 Tax=Sulfuricurvum sp. TaxID=2025608 RepID=UPI00261F0F50|nr:LolA-like outer membrane lipoprotein chaperone [Sulfuricurvum sp.]MDD2829918.1 LolA-like outer membrane lipoprotein chaperone [Sulfuricurvum sp.]MDD4949592.1 LolA-like outer membrane lipoprotein chaperone [Sulfuricurvum sp.]